MTREAAAEQFRVTKQWEADIAVQYARDTRWTAAEATRLAITAILSMRDEIEWRAKLHKQPLRVKRIERMNAAKALQDDWLLRS